MLENKPVFLITGLPGSGKTARGVEAIQKAAAEGRPIFQTGIPELKIPHIPVPPINEWTELRPDPDHPEVLCPYFTFPEKAVIYISEAQRWFRPRPSGSKIPDHVAAFETCRHTGVTFILDTQHPDFIDAHVRKLVGQHVHLLDHGMIGRWHYEWPYCGRVEDFKGAPIKKKYSLPKHVFGLYKSSSLHIKRKYTVPPQFILLALLLLFLGWVGWRMYPKFAGTEQTASPPAAAVSASAIPAPTTTQTASLPDKPDRAEMLVEFAPAVPGRPETAPAYDALRQVKNMPVVIGCMATAKRCRCVTQQGTDAGLDDMQCRQWLANPPFDPYREPPPVVDVKDKPPAEKPSTPPEAQPVKVAEPAEPRPQPENPAF